MFCLPELTEKYFPLPKQPENIGRPAPTTVKMTREMMRKLKLERNEAELERQARLRQCEWQQSSVSEIKYGA